MPYAWGSLLASLIAFLLFLIPKTRTNWVTLNLGCLLIWAGVYIEKGIGLVWMVAMGVFSIGFLVFTALVKIAAPILSDQFRHPDAPAAHLAASH